MITWISVNGEVIVVVLGVGVSNDYSKESPQIQLLKEQRSWFPSYITSKMMCAGQQVTPLFSFFVGNCFLRSLRGQVLSSCGSSMHYVLPYLSGWSGVFVFKGASAFTWLCLDQSNERRLYPVSILPLRSRHGFAPFPNLSCPDSSSREGR